MTSARLANAHGEQALEVGGAWIAPWRLADDYHVYGLGMGQGRTQVLRRWRRGPHRRKHPLAPATSFDLRQRDDARLDGDAQGRRFALDVQRGICAGMEATAIRAEDHENESFLPDSSDSPAILLRLPLPSTCGGTCRARTTPPAFTARLRSWPPIPPFAMVNPQQGRKAILSNASSVR